MAIDFGTTYSGFAFSFVKDRGASRVFKSRGWVNEDGNSTEKTPTCLLLKPDLSFDSFGYEAVEKYAHLQDESSEHAYYFLKHFMMNLLNDQVRYGCSCACLDNSGIRLCWDIFNKLLYNCDDHILILCLILFLQSRVKMNSTNCSVPNVWIFIAQLIGHCIANAETGGLFLESPGKLLSVCRVYIQDQSSIILKIKTKLSVNEAKLTELCYYSTGFDFKIGLRARKVSGPSEKGALEFESR